MKVKAEVESKVKVSVDKFDKAKVNRGVEQRGESGLEGGRGTCACAWHVDFVRCNARAALRQLDRTAKGREGQREREGQKEKKEKEGRSEGAWNC